MADQKKDNEQLEFQKQLMCADIVHKLLEHKQKAHVESNKLVVIAVIGMAGLISFLSTHSETKDLNIGVLLLGSLFLVSSLFSRGIFVEKTVSEMEHFYLDKEKKINLENIENKKYKKRKSPMNILHAIFNTLTLSIGALLMLHATGFY